MILGRRPVLALAAIVITGVLAFSVPQQGGTPPPAVAVAPWVFAVDEDDIEGIRVTHRSDTQGFVKNGQEWFSEADATKPVHLGRWGGITLLLRGLRAIRALPELPEPDESYRLGSPVTRIELQLRGERSLTIDVGVANPAGTADYVRASGIATTYLVDRSWRSVLARLVTEPPFDH